MSLIQLLGTFYFPQPLAVLLAVTTLSLRKTGPFSGLKEAPPDPAIALTQRHSLLRRSDFDPCPAGWRVPKGEAPNELQNPWFYFSLDNSRWTGVNPAAGRYWDMTVVFNGEVWYPVTGYRIWTSGWLSMCGVEISCWSSTRHDNKNYYLFSNQTVVNPGGFQGGYAVSSIGFPVRCLRE